MKYIYYNDNVYSKQYRLKNRYKIRKVCSKIFATTIVGLVCLFILFIEIIEIKIQQNLVNFINIFAMKDLRVVGNQHLSKEDVLHCAGIKYNNSNNTINNENGLFIYNSWSILNNLKSCKEIEKAEVIRRFPSSLLIQITEKKAYAIWRQQNQFFLLDYNGEIIRSYVTHNEKAQYIILFGESANKEANNILPLLENIMNDLYSEIASLHFISQRRWNILMINGLLIKLPENNIQQGLEILIKIMKQKSFLLNGAKVIDLRLLPERIFLK